MLHPLSESPEWLKVFSCDFANWSGLSLSSEAEVNSRLRGVIAEKRPSLIEMRNYLFSRQCAMLLKVHKPWEVSRLGDKMTNKFVKFTQLPTSFLAYTVVRCTPIPSPCSIFCS